jgi:DNA-binding NtrC family response regulator
MKTISLKKQVQNFEKGIIEDAIRDNAGNLAAVARILKIDRKVLYQKIERYRIKR